MGHIRKTLFILVPLLIAVSACVQVLLPSESDKGWLLHAAHGLLAGKKLYIDIIEINPPLIVWLYTLPAWISEHVKTIADFEALAFIGLVGVFYVSWVGRELIRLHPAFENSPERLNEFVLLELLIFIFYTPQGYFFDREHIFFVFIFPYMLRFMPALAEKKIPIKLQWIVGLTAALGFCIKPHTIIVFGIIQLFSLLRTRSLAALLNNENYIIAGTALLYFLCIDLFNPEYIRTIAPMAITTYSQFGNRNSGYVYLPPFFVALGLMFADFRPWHITPFRRDVYYLFGMCFAFLLYALSNNGWGYTYNPLYCLLMLTAAWMLWEYSWLHKELAVHGLPVRNILFGMRGCIIVLVTHAAYMTLYLIFMGISLNALRSPCDENPECWNNAPFVRYMDAEHLHSFGTISFDFSNWISLMHATGANWETRFNHLWMMPKLIQGDDAFRRAHYWIVELVGKDLAEDMDYNKPEVIFVDNSPFIMEQPRKNSLLDFLSEIPEFKTAWQQYHLVKTIDICQRHGRITQKSTCKFDVYMRKNSIQNSKTHVSQ